MTTCEQRRNDAIAIWQAGVDAVRSDHLVEQSVICDDQRIRICGHSFSTEQLRRIEVTGFGKAGAGMARGLAKRLREAGQIKLTGWINVPEDCVEAIPEFTVHPARPAGKNEPTKEGVAGTMQILKRLESLNENDLSIVLISGGGSALLPAPAPPVTLEDKLSVTRMLARAGATIEELNTVRSQISLVKGGGLLRHCRAGTMISLIISDVIGDPLEMIASGPTVPSDRSAQKALDVLRKYDPQQTSVPTSVMNILNSDQPINSTPNCEVHNHIIGSNAVALAAAAAEAERRGYVVSSLGDRNSGDASEWGRKLFTELSTRALGDAPACVLAGGETTVRLTPTDQPRRGGRNQEAILAAVTANREPNNWEHLTLLSGGTDGEDGPTNAAGAIADGNLIQTMQRLSVDPDEYLAINNSFPFFEQLDGLLTTGPTHTNVMDLAVGLYSV